TLLHHFVPIFGMKYTMTSYANSPCLRDASSPSVLLISASPISPFADILGYNYTNEEDGLDVVHCSTFIGTGCCCRPAVHSAASPVPGVAAWTYDCCGCLGNLVVDAKNRRGDIFEI